MKIAILTFHYSENYGAAVQAYALKTHIESKGHEVVFLNYMPDRVEKGKPFNWKQPFCRDNVKYVFLRVAAVVTHAASAKKRALFRNFRDRYLPESPAGAPVRSINALKLELSRMDLDLVISGSDQVWAPICGGELDAAYYLRKDLFPVRAKRVSYAPSFGTYNLADEYHDEFGEYLRSLDLVSVREPGVLPFVESFSAKEISLVPDPTFLLDDYSPLLSNETLPSGAFIFCYALRDGWGIGKLAKGLAASLDCDLYSPSNPHRRWPSIGTTLSPGPSEWLSLIANAKLVVTNSFHGVALSVCLNVEFVFSPLPGRNKDLNARALDLLEILGLESRIVNDNTLPLVGINWESVNRKVAEMREDGVGFLDKALALPR